MDHETQEEVQTPPEAPGFGTFAHKDRKYALLIPKLQLGKKVHSAQDIAESEALQEQLVALAWEGPDGEREEEDFARNGILKLVY